MSGFLKVGSIDYILAINVIYFLNPLEDYIKEMFRVIRPNGKILIVCKEAPLKNGHDSVFINKDINKMIEIITKVGFIVEKKNIDLKNKKFNYTAIIMKKQ